MITKRVILPFLIFALPLVQARAADVHYFDFVPALPTATAPGTSDYVAIIQGGVSKKTNLSLSTLGLTAGNGIAIATGTVSSSLTNTAGSKTTDYTVVAGDMGGVIGLGGSSAHNLTLPAISSTIFANNMSVCYNVEGTGTWTIVNNTGGSLLGLPSTTIPQYAGGCFWSDGANLHWEAGTQGGTLLTVRSLGAEFTVTAGSLGLTTNGVTNAMLAQAGARTIRGNNSGSTANVADQSSFSITAASAINANTASLLTAQTGTLMQIQAADTVAARYEADAFGAQAFFSGVCANGTKASPTTMTAATQCGGYNFFGYDGTSYGGPAASFRTYANQTWTGSAHGSYATVATTPNGSTTLTDVLKFENDGGMTTPSVTGGDKGVGTINAAGLYVNGLAVSVTGGTIKSQYTNTMTGTVASGTPKYYLPMGSDGGSTSNNVASALISALNGTIVSIYVQATANAGGTSTTGGFVYTVYKNNVATSMTCTIAFNASPVKCNDTTAGHAVSVSIGDLVSIQAQMTADGTGSWKTSTAAMEFDAS